MEDYILPNKPVVITNFQESWAPLEAFTKAALVREFGRSFVRVSVSQTGRFDGPESGELWGLGDEVDVLVRLAAL
jgi:hypothetical protein